MLGQGVEVGALFGLRPEDAQRLKGRAARGRQRCCRASGGCADCRRSGRRAQEEGDPSVRCADSSPLRTETPLWDVPVLRSAYFHKEYTVLFAPKRSTFRFAALTLRVTSHRNAPSGRSGVAHGFFSEKSILCFFLQNAHASGSLRSPYGCLRAVRRDGAKREVAGECLTEGFLP